jgi:pimeloyl-ACP methyl ester carboxylesterase
VETFTDFVEARDGTRLFCRDWGSGRPLVFAAPWALNSGWWEYQTTWLAAHGLRCVSYDRRGHGRSSEPAHGYEFDTLADDLATVIERLDLRDITLVGHSMGCGEVVRYLTRHGSGHGTRRVARAALVATITPFILKTADNPDGVDKSVFEAGRAALSKDRPQQIAKAAPGFFGAPANSVSAEIMNWWTRMLVDQCSLKVMLQLHRVFTETDFRPELRKITVPTLLIHGDSDTSAPIDFTARRTAPLIPDCRLKIYEKAAHGLPFTHMDQLNADLLEFAG